MSFPATAANYSKAIEHSKERFGREDLLVQIHVRDIVSLVMKNVASGRAKVDLSSLFVLTFELEEKLRALESLGRTEENGDFLTPLVESYLYTYKGSFGNIGKEQKPSIDGQQII